MYNLQLSQFSLKNTISHSLIVGTLTTVGLLSGVIPEFSAKTANLSFSTTAFAQEFSNEQITNYARVVLDMESTRQTVLSNIEAIIGSKPEEIPCYQPRSLSRLPRNARELAINYCRDYKTLIENRGLTISEFNNLTRRAQSDAGVKRRIQDAMIQILRQQ